MPGAGLGAVNNGSEILRDDIGSVLDPWREVMSRNGFIGGRVSPILPVKRQAGSFKRRPIGGFLKRINTKRMSDGTLRRIYVSMADGTFFTRPFGLEYPVDEWDRAVYENDWDMVTDGVEELRDAMARDFEISVAELVQDPAQYEESWQHVDAEKAWNDPTSDIIGDVERLRQLHEQRMIPFNAMIVSDRVYRQMLYNHAIIARINSEGAGTQTLPEQITKRQLCSLFLLDEILIGKGVYDPTNETTADSETDLPMNLNRIWKDDTVELGRVLPAGQTPSLRKPSYSYTLQWNRGPGGRGEQVDQYYEHQRQGWVMRVRTNRQILIVGNKTYGQIRGTWG